jgi:hypothetical protein
VSEQKLITELLKMAAECAEEGRAIPATHVTLFRKVISQAVFLKPSELRALRNVRNMAEINSCGCSGDLKGRGYNGHDPACPVHHSKNSFKIVSRFLTDAERRAA